jgi:hypothetical protein
VAGARERVDLGHWPPGALRDHPGTARLEHGLHAETRALEERRLREALARSRWNKSQAARSLGLSRQGLLKKLRRLELDEPLRVADAPHDALADAPPDPMTDAPSVDAAFIAPAEGATLDAPRGAP